MIFKTLKKCHKIPFNIILVDIKIIIIKKKEDPPFFQEYKTPFKIKFMVFKTLKKITECVI